MSIKNSDIETIYNRIRSRIDLIGSYMDDTHFLPKIIKSCRLKPYTLFTNDFNSKFVFEPHWVDEFGNSLWIKNKTIKIIINDTQINPNTKISSDLFFANSVDTIARNSKCVMIVNVEHCNLITFYGKDEYLRTFILNGEIARVSPILLGINSLREYFKSMDSIPPSHINHNNLDLLIKSNIVNCLVSFQPVAWKDHIRRI